MEVSEVVDVHVEGFLRVLVVLTDDLQVLFEDGLKRNTPSLEIKRMVFPALELKEYPTFL